MDGISAFVLKELGAAEVVATDMDPRETFLFARDVLNLDIDYRTPVSLQELPILFKEDRFDLIVMAGILYHVFDPLTALSICRDLLKNNGLLFMETFYLFDEAKPCMVFNPKDNSKRGVERANVFWRPSKTSIEGMLEVAGFKVIASIAFNARITFIAQAKKTSEIDSSSARIKNIHKRYMNYKNYRERTDYNLLEKQEVGNSNICYEGPRSHIWLNRSRYTPMVPFQPEWSLPSGMDGLGERIRCMVNCMRTNAARRWCARRTLRRVRRAHHL
jgi:SAM-dependent methyltransferase